MNVIPKVHFFKVQNFVETPSDGPPDRQIANFGASRVGSSKEEEMSRWGEWAMTHFWGDGGGKTVLGAPSSPRPQKVSSAYN